jgi:hypothetical protein
MLSEKLYEKVSLLLSDSCRLLFRLYPLHTACVGKFTELEKEKQINRLRMKGRNEKRKMERNRKMERKKERKK